MNKRVYFLVGFVFILSVLGIFYYGLFFSSDPKEIPSALIGKKAKPFTVTTFDGRKVSLDQFKGQPVILNFWASWCVSCRNEARLLEKLHRMYTPMGAVFIGIAINDKRVDSLAFIRKYGKTYMTAPDDAMGSISLDYGVSAVPETFFIDKAGIIQHKHLSEINLELVHEFVSKQLAL